MSVCAAKMFASQEHLRSPRGVERELLLLLVVILMILIIILLITVMIILMNMTIMAHTSKYAAAATKHFERGRVDETCFPSSFEAHLIIYRQQHLIIYRQQHECHTQSVTDTG